MTVLHLVRHGQSVWNAAGLLQGQASGVGLSPLGHRQAADAARALPPVEAVYSSDLLRARQSAAPVSALHGRPVRLEPGLRERGYGRYEGQASTDVLAATADVDWADPDLRLGGGESLRQVHERVAAALGRIVARHPGGSVAVVSHGDAIRVAAGLLAGHGPADLPWRDVPNGSVTSLRTGTVTHLIMEARLPR